MTKNIGRLTVRTWQSRSSRPLTSEDAREIISNASGFFRVLAEWDESAGGLGDHPRTKEPLPPRTTRKHCERLGDEQCLPDAAAATKEGT